MSEYEQAVFISYAWGQEGEAREAIVNQLDQSLQQRGLRIIRDKRDLGYKGSIREFMTRIGDGNCIIVVISDKYLRSKNCMFELVEIAENKQFSDRIFPIILDDAKIYDPGDRVDYIAYWENKKAELNEKLNILRDKSNALGILTELHDYDRFHDEIDNLTSTLKDMNCLSPGMLREADFQQLYDALVERMSVASPTLKNTTPGADLLPKGIFKLKKERKRMDPITLATAATTLLAPYISKVGEKTLEKLADQLPEKLGAVWNGIWDRLKEKPAAADAANDLVTDPADPVNQQMFTGQLKKVLEKDENFAGQLTDLLEEAKSDSSINIGGDGIVATNNSMAVGGDIQANNNTGSTISIGNVQGGRKKN